MIDKDGYRANVGIILTNDNKEVLLAKRYKEESWQFPQGGIDYGEIILNTLYRELYEEIGLEKKDVSLIARTPKWLRYKLPKGYLKPNQKPFYIGQKQVWFMLKMQSPDNKIRLDVNKDIEFDDWKWVEFWSPIDEVVDFKKNIYEDVLKILAPVLFNNQHQVPAKFSRPLKFNAIIM